jgi:hypothetical protein
MNVADAFEFDIAMHPQYVDAAERFADDALSVAVSVGATLVEDAIPLGEFLKPIVTVGLNDLKADLAAKIKSAMQQYIQAQPNVKQGDGHAGLVSIKETNTPGGTK